MPQRKITILNAESTHTYIAISIMLRNSWCSLSMWLKWMYIMVLFILCSKNLSIFEKLKIERYFSYFSFIITIVHDFVSKGSWFTMVFEWLCTFIDMNCIKMYLLQTCIWYTLRGSHTLNINLQLIYS